MADPPRISSPAKQVTTQTQQAQGPLASWNVRPTQTQQRTPLVGGYTVPIQARPTPATVSLVRLQPGPSSSISQPMPYPSSPSPQPYGHGGQRIGGDWDLPIPDSLPALPATPPSGGGGGSPGQAQSSQPPPSGYGRLSVSDDSDPPMPDSFPTLPTTPRSGGGGGSPSQTQSSQPRPSGHSWQSAGVSIRQPTSAAPHPSSTSTQSSPNPQQVMSGPKATGHIVKVSAEAQKAVGNHLKPEAQHAVADPSRLLDWETLRAALGDKASRKIPSEIQAGLAAFKNDTAAQVHGDAHQRGQAVTRLKAQVDSTMAALDEHIARAMSKSKGREQTAGPLVRLKEQLEAYKTLLDGIAKDGPPPGTQPSYIDMLKTRAFGMPDSALRGIATHGRQGAIDNGHLGSGAVNSTRSVKYPNEPHRMVFKPMHAATAGSSGMEATAGIDLDHPRFANRNVATTVAARHLGLDHMVPRTTYAALDDQVGIAMERLGGFSLPAFDSNPILLSDADKRFVEKREAQLTKGRLLDADGKKLEGRYTPENFIYELSVKNIIVKPDQTYGKQTHEAYKLDPGHPDFLVQVNDAEWLHALTGEVDPNSGNMRVIASSDTAPQLKLFDFDFSFGASVHDVTRNRSGNNRQTLPPLISAKTLNAFNDLIQNWPQRKLEYAEHLSQPEITALETRLFGGPYTDAAGNAQQAKGIKGHLQELTAQNRVVSDWTAWRGDDGSGNQVDASALMRDDARRNNGYLDRIEAFVDESRGERAKVGL